MNISKWIRLMKYTTLVLCLALFAGCDGSGKDKSSWEEEVQLENGQVIWIQRIVESVTHSAEWSGGGGGRVDYLQNTIIIPQDNPVAPAPPVWTAKTDVPMLLDYDEEKQTWFIVTTFFMCGDWVNWGKPVLPYRQYEVRNGKWVLVPLDEKLIGRQANLLAGIMNSKIKRVTIEDRLRIIWNAGDKYKAIITTWDGCRDDR